MTDEKYTLISDIKEKKTTARSAFARKGGARSKKCTLPSDYLTAAEKRRRNSPVSTVKLNQPITYAELKELSPSLRVLYLDHLIHEYRARQTDIAAMLGITPPTFYKFMKKLPGKLDFGAVRKKPAPEWLEFIGGQAPEITPPPLEVIEPEIGPDFGIEEPEIVPPPEPDPEPQVKVEPLTVELPLIIKPTVLPDKVTFSLTGTPGQLVDLLPVFTKPDNKYRFELSLTLIDE